MRVWFVVQHKCWAWVSDLSYRLFNHSSYEAYKAHKRATK